MGRPAMRGPSASGSPGPAGWDARNVLLMDDLGQPRARPGLGADRGLAADPGQPRLGVHGMAGPQGQARRHRRDLLRGPGDGVAAPNRRPAGEPRRSLSPADRRALRTVGEDRLAARRGDRRRRGDGQNPVVCWLDTSLIGRGRRVDRRVGLPAVGDGDAPETVPLAGRDRLAGRRWPARCRGRAGRRAQPVHRRAARGARHPRAASQPARLPRPLEPEPRTGPARGSACSAGSTRTSTSGRRRSGRRAWRSGSCSSSAGTPAAISAIAFTADGSRMITGAQDSTVKVWTVADRLVLRALCVPHGRRDQPGPEPRRQPARQRRRRGLAPDLGHGPSSARSRRARRTTAASTASRSCPTATHLVSLDMDGKSWLLETGGPERTGQAALEARQPAWPARPGRADRASLWPRSDGKVRLYDPDGNVVSGPGRARTVW